MRQLKIVNIAQLAVIGALGLTLASCGGNAASSRPASPASSAAAGAPAKPSTSGAASAAAVPSVAVVGQRAPGPYAASGTTTVTNGAATIEGTDALKWQPNTILAKGGDKVTLQIKNAGNTAHTFISPGLGVNSAQDTPIGKTVPVSFTAPTAPGAYQFWCNVPGHAETGMVGEVIVQ